MLKAEPPARALEGIRRLVAGKGFCTVNRRELETKAPGVETVICVEPAEETSEEKS